MGKGVIWDLPLRLFHWLLMLAVIGAIASAKLGSTFWHEKAGLSVAALIVFRIIWGFVGSHHARFSNFLTSPLKVFAYIKSRINGDRSHYPGHMPTGAWATVAILLIIGAMATLGMMSTDDVLYYGPLASLVGDFSSTATSLHHMGERAVFAIIGLHVAALVIYFVALKINLLPAMVFGGEDKSVSPISTTRQIAGLVLMATLLLTAHGAAYGLALII